MAVELTELELPIAAWLDDDETRALFLLAKDAATLPAAAAALLAYAGSEVPVHSAEATALFREACDLKASFHFVTFGLSVRPRLSIDRLSIEAALDELGSIVLEKVAAGANEVIIDFGGFGAVQWSRRATPATDATELFDDSLLKLLASTPTSSTDVVQLPSNLSAALLHVVAQGGRRARLMAAVAARPRWPLQVAPILTRLANTARRGADG